MRRSSSVMVGRRDAYCCLSRRLRDEDRLGSSVLWVGGARFLTPRKWHARDGVVSLALGW